jgi:hypothetical protein
VRRPFAFVLVLALEVLAGELPPAPPLAVSGLELAESRFGPRRASRKFVPGERVYVRALVEDLSPGRDGALALGVGIALDRPEAEVAPEEDLRAPDLFAARAFPLAVSFPIPPGAQAGEHRLVIALEDRTSGARATRTLRIEVAPPSGLVALNPFFAADPDGRIERPAEFRVGETVRLFFGVLGLEALGGRVRLEGDLEVRDAASGKTISARPRALAIEEAAQGGLVALDASIAATATRPGRFLFRIVVRDRNAAREAVIERGIEVRP